jgi:hypothetical protein
MNETETVRNQLIPNIIGEICAFIQSRPTISTYVGIKGGIIYVVYWIDFSSLYFGWLCFARNVDFSYACRIGAIP